MQPRLSLAAVVLAVAGMLAGATDAGSRTHNAGSPLVPRIVARALPAVVSITTRQIEYDQFNQPSSTRGLGSGFLLDRSGHVLTNNHVIDGAEEIKVALTDGRVFRATMVGADRFTDLAVLKIEGRSLPALRLAASSKLAVGETVVAIGSPLWIEGVRKGSRLALARTMSLSSVQNSSRLSSSIVKLTARRTACRNADRSRLSGSIAMAIDSTSNVS